MNKDRVISICEKSGISLPKNFWHKMTEYAELIQNNSKGYGIISLRETEHIWERHILDSLALLLFANIEETMSVLDYGSGGGLPGIVLASATDAKFTLAESNSRKASFIQIAKKQLNLQNVFVFSGRVKDIDKKFNLITIRATGPLSRTIPDALKHLTKHGKVALWAGASFAQKIQYWTNFLSKRNAKIKIMQYPEDFSETRRLFMAFISIAHGRNQ